MAVSIIGPKFYAWDRNGNPLAGGKLYTYQTGTTTNKETYTDETGSVANENPVILNDEGYENVYLDGSYSLVLKDSDDVTIWTADPVSSSSGQEWINCMTATYLTATSVKVVGNYVDEFSEFRGIRVNNDTSGYAYSRVVSASYAGGETTLVLNDAVVETGVIGVCTSIITANSLPDESFFDDGNFIKFANSSMSLSDIKALFTGSSTIYFDAGTYAYTAEDVADDPALFTVPSNTKVVLSEGTTISLTDSELESYQFFDLNNVQNVEICGGKLIGDKASNTATGGEFGHGIDARNSKNIKIHDMNISAMWGDGVYIGGTTGIDNSENVSIYNNKISDCRRQGISIVACDGFEIYDNTITEISGTLPQSGIDIEPNPDGAGGSQFATTNGRVHSNYIYDCAGTGVLVTGPQRSASRLKIYDNVIEKCSRHVDASTTDEDLGLLEVMNNSFLNSDFSMGDFSGVKNLVMRGNVSKDNTTGGSGSIFGFTFTGMETLVIDDSFMDNVFQATHGALRIDGSIGFANITVHLENSRGVIINSATIDHWIVKGVFDSVGWVPVVVKTTAQVGTVSGDFSGCTANFPVLDENGDIPTNVNMVDYVDTIDYYAVNRIGGKLWGSQFFEGITPYSQFTPTLINNVAFTGSLVDGISSEGYGTADSLLKGSASGAELTGTTVRGLNLTGTQYYYLNYGDNPLLLNSSSQMILVLKIPTFSASTCILDGRYTEGVFENGIKLEHTASETLTLTYGDDSDLTQTFSIPEGEIVALSFLIEEDNRLKITFSNPYNREFSEILRPGNDSNNPTENLNIGAAQGGGSIFTGVIYDICIFEHHDLTFSERHFQRICDSIRRFYQEQSA